MNRILLICLILLTPVFGWAGGYLTLEGLIKTTGSETLTLSDDSKIYVLDLAKLGPEQAKKATSAKVGTSVQLQVPFDAIQSVTKK